MYICNVPMLRLKDRTVKRGDPVPEADTWPENIRRSNIRMGCIVLKAEATSADMNMASTGGHPINARVSTAPLPPLSPEQAQRRAAAPPWLVKEAEKGRVLQAVPGPAAPEPEPEQGGVTLDPGQGPSASTVNDEDDGSQHERQERQNRKRSRR